ncbi:MAG TPA: type II methionyl aminopeptidase [Candidatus Woesearchaeota archaeon]|nr:type II methionyl aminopeptidase [Candidatus Woesearchaeota archaeon]
METNKQYKDWLMAGKIAAIARDYGVSLIKKGAIIREILDLIEERIIKEGGQIAFPAQISLNNTAAHFCPAIDDNTLIGEDIIKLDVGAMVNGAIGDTAITIDLSGKNKELLLASKEGFEAGFKAVMIGAKISSVGSAIENAISKKGFNPIKNLSGHTMDIYTLHTHPSIPNYNTNDSSELIEGQVIAMEPFATTGGGRVTEQGIANVFIEIEIKNTRNPITKKIGEQIKSYNKMPFARRWLEKKFSKAMVALALGDLLRSNSIDEYKPLVEASDGLVSQYEHTILVLKTPIITTLTPEQTLQSNL